MQNRLRFAPQRRREGFRRRIAGLVAAVLVGTLCVPVVQMSVPALREQASAAVTNGSIGLSSSGAARISWATGLNLNLGTTFETWMNFTSIAGQNGIFSTCVNVGNGGSDTCPTWFGAVSLVWGSNGVMRVQPNGANQINPNSTTRASFCSITTIAPSTNTWYHIAISTPAFTGTPILISKIFINGNLIGNCPFVMNDSLVKGVTIGGTGNSGTNNIKLGPTRISKTARYSEGFTPLTTFPTSGDANTWAVSNTNFDSGSPTLCTALSDQNNKTLAFSTFNTYQVINAMTTQGSSVGGAGTATVTCNSSAPTSPAAPTNGSISLPSGTRALIGRFNAGVTNGSMFLSNTIGDNSYRYIGSGGWTWEGWVKFSSTSTGYNTIFTGCDNGAICGVSGATRLEWRGSDGAVNFSSCTNRSTAEGSSPAVIPANNQWYHIAVSTATHVSGGAATNNYLFIDGVLRENCNATQTTWQIEGFTIGGTVGLTMKVGPFRFRAGQKYTTNFTPSVTYPTADTSAWAILNTQYENCFAVSDPLDRRGPYATLNAPTGNTVVYTATCSNDAPAAAAAAQAALTLSSTSGTYGTTLRLTTTGGSGTGAVTYATTTGGCNITNTDSLTVTSALTCSVTATKAADASYTLISSSATNVVFATRPLTIKAAAKSATYTGSSVSVSNSYSITSGTLVGSETFTALTYTYTSTPLSYNSATAPTIAGGYTITPSAASFSVGLASNYNITYETATLTINKANQGALTITTSTGKYGTPLRLTTSGGSGTGALSFAITSAGTASGCSITNETITVGSIGTCNVTATKALDTNYLVVNSLETIITFTKADTITVTTTLSSSSVTYNELPANVTVTQTVTGLVGSDTATVSSTYTLINSCEAGGNCAIGDLAPGGGYVFYVSATPINIATGISTGGIYLATAPQTWYGGATDPIAGWGCSGTDISGTSAAVGSGAQNTWLNTIGCATAGRASRLAADSSAEGFTDWFMPSIGELNLIYSNLKLAGLSNLNGADYWSSTQDATNPGGSAQYQWFGGGSSGPTDKNNTLSVRPIRAFSPTAVASNTIPTEVGTYQVSSALTLSSPASINNYQGVESVTATLTINRARQKTISIGQYQAYPNMSSYPLNVYGGSGPGILTRTLVSAGTAGCSLAGSFILTATSVGTCTVQVEKAGTRNYFGESTTATIYWIAWNANYALQSVVENNAIPLSAGNSFIVRTETVTASAFSSTGGSAITSAAVGTTIRINSTSFAGLSPADLSVTFRPYEDAVITAVTSTYVEIVIPAGSVTGVIAIDSPKGVAYTQSFTVSP